MLKKNLLVVALASAFAMPAMAETTFSSNVGLVSDYLYRGISQTGTGPAIQGGFDLSDSSGVYAGVWASSISWLSDAGIADNAGTEIDTYVGYKGAAGDVGYDVGFLRYNYPGEYGTAVKADTNEIYGAVSYSIVTAKLSYSLGDLFGVADAKGSTYAEVNVSYPVADTGVTVGAHYGKQSYKGANSTGLTYSDYKLSVTKDFSGYVVGAAYSNTNAGALYTVLGNELGKSTVVLSLTRAM
ncbi:MAG: TorF family putative porin [Gammaproteobacteria bacterium]|nr:TorF family putative porin [Gammaproteobacteria bacterium]MBU1777093.1 TorF family putative porin [Gammaproteobacteria bacterium]MBU1968108.1 TorF family putative porin [Gammaproteobacteria bacterium]